MFDMFTKDPEEQESSSYSSDAPQGDTFVIAIGGSLLVKAKPDVEKINEIAEAISSLHSAGKKIVLVVGGGKTARNYVEAMPDSVNNFELDLMGIKITRVNAALLASHIENTHPKILTEITKAKEVLSEGKIPVFGGLMPFFTTDAVAALLAEFLNANFVNLTTVDGIYNEDPNEYENAKKYDEISYDSLISLISSAGSKPGQNLVLDIACCMILKRSNILGVVLSGEDIENFKNYMNGYTFNGTKIKEVANEDIKSEDVEELMDKPKRKRKTKKKIKGHKSNEPFSADDVDKLKF